MKTIQVIIKGKVQGIGFRATIEHYANKVGVYGSVKNLQNGSVEVYAQGPEEQLEVFLDELRQTRGLAKIEHISVEECVVQKKYTGFEILF